MKGEAPKLLASGDFAAKLNGAAVALGKEDKSVLGRLRKILDDCVSKGREYWGGCREATEDALRGADLTDSDWDLLVKKMKHNLFFTGGKAELFINRCPKEKLTHLLLDQDGSDWACGTDSRRRIRKQVLGLPYCVHFGRQQKGWIRRQGSRGELQARCQSDEAERLHPRRPLVGGEGEGFESLQASGEEVR